MWILWIVNSEHFTEFPLSKNTRIYKELNTCSKSKMEAQCQMRTYSKLTMISALFWCPYRNIKHIAHLVFIADFKQAIVSGAFKTCVFNKEQPTKSFFIWRIFLTKERTYYKYWSQKSSRLKFFLSFFFFLTLFLLWFFDDWRP